MMHTSRHIRPRQGRTTVHLNWNKPIGATHMGKNFTYVDNSNVYIEGCRLSAVKKGLPGAATIVEAMNNRVVDFDWHLDYGRLHGFVCGNDPTCIGRANLW